MPLSVREIHAQQVIHKCGSCSEEEVADAKGTIAHKKPSLIWEAMKEMTFEPRPNGYGKLHLAKKRTKSVPRSIDMEKKGKLKNNLRTGSSL